MAREVTIKFGSGALVGAAESAEILGVKTPQISRWEKAGKMPEPVEELKASKVWLRADIEAKKKAEGR